MRMEEREITERKPKEYKNDPNDASYRFQGKNPGESQPPKNLCMVSQSDFRGRLPGDPRDLSCVRGKGNAKIPGRNRHSQRWVFGEGIHLIGPGSRNRNCVSSWNRNHFRAKGGMDGEEKRKI